MLLPLEALKKIEEASLALEFRDLIGIAAYSVSPSTAYKVARRLEWRNDKALSCRYLAMILRDYGSKAFLKLVVKRNPEDYQDLCLCDCHLRHWEFDAFLENGNGDWEWDCDCNCCSHSECFHAAHTFDYECEFCDNGDGEYESRERFLPPAARQLKAKRAERTLVQETPEQKHGDENDDCLPQTKSERERRKGCDVR